MRSPSQYNEASSYFTVQALNDDVQSSRVAGLNPSLYRPRKRLSRLSELSAWEQSLPLSLSLSLRPCFCPPRSSLAPLFIFPLPRWFTVSCRARLPLVSQCFQTAVKRAGLAPSLPPSSLSPLYCSLPRLLPALFSQPLHLLVLSLAPSCYLSLHFSSLTFFSSLHFFLPCLSLSLYPSPVLSLTFFHVVLVFCSSTPSLPNSPLLSRFLSFTPSCFLFISDPIFFSLPH